MKRRKMKTVKKIEKSIKKLTVESSERIHDRMIDKLQRMLDTSKKHTTIEQTSIWRIIMKSRMTKLATVTVVILAVVVGVILIDRSTTPAYAVDQTIAANQTIRTLHVRVTGNENGIENNEYTEAWIQCDATGRMTNLRVNIYEGNLNEGGEGRYHAVWNNGVDKIWKPSENKLFIYRVNDTEARINDFAKRYDPKFMQHKLYDASQNKEQFNVTIDDSEHEGFIYVEVLDRDNKSRLELLVDPETKLVAQLDEYDLDKQGGKLTMRVEFLAYNQPIDPELFEFNDIPEDVLVIDKAHTLVGIKKEAMSDHEVAVEVVRQCLEATIARDYDKVSRLMEGDPGDTIENFIEEELGTRLVRVVSMGQPRPFKTWQHILYVPCEIEVENGAGTRWTINIITMARSIDYQSGNRWVMIDEQLQVDGPDHIVNEILGSFARGIIVPDVCVGDYLLGTSKDDVLARRGEPKSFGYEGEGFAPNNLPNTYYIEYHDLWFFMQDGSVTGILIKKPFYQFANGLKMGDSKENIIQTFGHDFVVIIESESDPSFILTYKDKGLSFWLNKENNAINGIEVYSSGFLKNLYRQVSIGGTWQGSCQQVVQDGEVKHQKTTFNYLGDTVKIERIDYQDENCNIKSSSLVFTGAYAIPRMSTTPGARDIDYTVKSMTATFHTMAVVNKVNQMKYLGYSDWQVNVTRDITGAPGISSKGDKHYEIFRIENGNKLYIGSNEAMGSSSRPTSLRRFYAIRQ
jgi:hypothetical protein